jgi:hypothetical protein
MHELDINEDEAREAIRVVSLDNQIPCSRGDDGAPIGRSGAGCLAVPQIRDATFTASWDGFRTAKRR